MSYKEDCEFIERLKQPVTHYIFDDTRPLRWQVYGALSLDRLTPVERRGVVHRYMAEGRRVIKCKNGPYKDIQPIYRAIKENQIP